MSRIKFILLLLLISNVLLEDSHVIVLTNENFNNEIKNHNKILVKFYAPWCGHCKSLAPEFDKAAKMLKDANSDSFLANIDCTVHREKCNEFSIRGYPTLLFFQNQVHTKYTGNRTAQEIIQWLSKYDKVEKAVATSKEIKSSPEIEVIKKNVKANETVAILLGDKGLDDFLELSSKFEKVTFYHCIIRECYKDQIKPNGTILLLKEEKYQKSLIPEFTKERLLSFIEDKAPQAFINMELDVYMSLIKEKKKMIIMFYNKETQSQVETLANKLHSKLKGEISIVLSKDESQPEKNTIHVYNFEINQYPVIAIMETLGSRPVKYYYKKETIDANEIYSFYNEWKSGKLQFDIKTEPVPTTQNGYVTKVVGSTFEKIVKDNTKDVLIKYYSPKCGHCVKIAPVYEELAKKYSNQKNLIIAEVDCKANELEFQIGAFPTFHFWPANNKKSIYFKGERSFDGLSKFIEDNRSLKEEIKINKDDL